MFSRDTFHSAINFVDRYLSLKIPIQKQDLQLIGVTSLFISSKLEESLKYKVKVAMFSETT